MKNLMYAFFSFLRNVFLKDSPESSKRFFGGIGMIACIFMICVFDRDLLSELLYVSAGLLGIGLLDKVSKL